MKKLLFLITIVILVASCNDEQYANDFIELDIDNIQVKDIITAKTDTFSVDLRLSTPHPSWYERSIPIYRYIHLDGQRKDHYYGSDKPSPEIEGTQKVIKNKNYYYEHQDFNLISYDSKFPYLRPIYRHYSSAINDHILSPSSTVANYSSEGLLGYAFTFYQPGAVPLYEYYSPTEKNHLYVASNDELEYLRIINADYTRKSFIGWVYLGKRGDPSRTQETFIFETIGNIHFPDDYPPFSITVKLKYIEQNGNYREDVHTRNFTGRLNERQSIPLSNYNRGNLWSGEMVVHFPEGSPTGTFYNIIDPDFKGQEYGWHGVLIEQLTFEHNYNAVFQMKLYSTAVGN